MVLINLKIVIRHWKKILFIAFVATLFLFLKGGFESNDNVENVLVFSLMFFGSFIAVSAFCTAGSKIH